MVPSAGCLPDEPFPPLAMAEVECVERKLGDRLPSLLQQANWPCGNRSAGGRGLDGAAMWKAPNPPSLPRICTR